MKLFSLHLCWRDLAMSTLLCTVYSCNFAQSVEKDLITGLTSRGKGLSCNEVYLSDGENVIKRNTFTYGETFHVNFDGMEGFVREGEGVFPDMQLLIISVEGDTALHLDDLYAGYEDGIDFSPLQLYAEVTVANPIHTEIEYTLHVNIRDKKGEGTYMTRLDFTVVRDKGITVESEILTSREVYLFSQQRGLTITNGLGGFDENIYLLFEGLEGFAVNAGQVKVGLSMVLKDASGSVILDEADLFGDTPLDYEDVHLQMAPNFILTGTEFENPLNLVVRIWDKGSPAWISASTEIVVE